MGFDRGRLGSRKTLLNGIERKIQIVDLFAIAAIGEECAGVRLNYAPLRAGIRVHRSESESVPLYNGGKPGLQLIADS